MVLEILFSILKHFLFIYFELIYSLLTVCCLLIEIIKYQNIACYVSCFTVKCQISSLQEYYGGREQGNLSSAYNVTN